MFQPHVHPNLIHRRELLKNGGLGLGAIALTSLMESDRLLSADGSVGRDTLKQPLQHSGQPGLPHFAAKAKRVIYLFQSGAPSQMDLFDYKPMLAGDLGPIYQTLSVRGSG